LHSKNQESLKKLGRSQVYMESLARTAKIVFQADGEKPKSSATSVVGEVEVFVPLKGLINLEDEERRLQKEITKIIEELNRTHLKLRNEEFLRKARPEAIEKEREKAKALAEKEAKFKEGFERLRTWKAEA